MSNLAKYHLAAATLCDRMDTAASWIEVECLWSLYEAIVDFARPEWSR